MSEISGDSFLPDRRQTTTEEAADWRAAGEVKRSRELPSGPAIVTGASVELAFDCGQQIVVSQLGLVFESLDGLQGRGRSLCCPA